MVLIFTFPSSKKSRNIRHLVVIDPESTHGIVNSRENSHGYFLRIITNELFIDFQDSPQFDLQDHRINMRQIEVNHVLPINPQTLIKDHFINSSSCNIARNKISVIRKHLFKEIPWFSIFVSPDSSAFATG